MDDRDWRKRESSNGRGINVTQKERTDREANERSDNPARYHSVSECKLLTLVFREVGSENFSTAFRFIQSIYLQEA